MSFMKSANLLKVLAFVVVLTLIIVLGSLFGIRHLTQSTGESTARDWAVKLMNIEAPNVSCVAQDTDGDGYVACTVYDPKAAKMIPVECATLFTFNNGCKIASRNVITQ